MQTAAKRPLKRDQAPAGSWSWLKEWTGYLTTVLPYVSAGMLLVPGIPVAAKAGILLFFAIFVLAIRVVHEKAGIEVTSNDERMKRPHANG